jgi:hypothetical protein
MSGTNEVTAVTDDHGSVFRAVGIPMSLPTVSLINDVSAVSFRICPTCLESRFHFLPARFQVPGKEDSGFRPSCVTGFPLRRFQGFSGRVEVCYQCQSGGGSRGGDENTPAGDYSLNALLPLDFRLVGLNSFCGRDPPLSFANTVRDPP